MAEDDVVIHEHALKHGLKEADILHAWENAYATQARSGPYPPQYISVGPDRAGRDIQLVSTWNPDDCVWVVFHAMNVTSAVKRELGLK